MKNICLSLCICFFSLTSAKSQDRSGVHYANIDALLKKYSSSNGPGCAVSIIKNGNLIYKNSYGLANLEYNIPLTTASVFDVASVAKQFTGFAISTLVQEGKISLSDDIRKYLPNVPDFGKVITIANLVHHTSGIRDWPEALQAAGWRYDELCSFDDIMNMVKHQRQLDFDPGTTFSYSNTGYNLLAAIVEKVTVQPFPTWAQAHIFKPMQMSSSFFLSDDSKLIRNEAYSYAPDNNNQYVKLQNVLTAYGSSSLYTNIDDLSKWVMYLDKGIAMNDPVYTRMLEAGILDNGSKTNYGFGLEIGDYEGLKTISHTGAWSGYRSVIRLYPEQKLSIIILSNGNNNNLNVEAMNDLSTLLLPNYKIPAGATVEKNKPELKINPLILNKYIGKYKWGPGEITFTIDNGQLQIQYSGEDRYPLQALTDSTFMFALAGFAVTFAKPVNDQSETFTFKSITGKRIPSFTPTKEQLIDYCGTYYSKELFTQYTVDVQNGKLMIHHFRRGDFELSPDGENTFNSDIGIIGFVKSSTNRTEGLNLSGNHVKNLIFDKINL